MIPGVLSLIKEKQFPLALKNIINTWEVLINLIEHYPIKRKTNRWPNRFTMHNLQILIRNAYVLYKEYCPEKKLDHFDFHHKFIEYLIKDDGFFKGSETHKF
ncbi:hypothetical protein CDIK_3338 [Cucumispora dikerogammari]|nr:hypothetical protein CDIK_3338 [Cucumispora dikerogammari]